MSAALVEEGTAVTEQPATLRGPKAAIEQPA